MKMTIFLFAAGAMLFATGCNDRAENEGMKNMKNNEMSVQHLNPEGLRKNPAFTQAVVVSGSSKTLYIGGQNAVDASGAIVGKSDLKAQTEQVYENLQIALEAGGAKLENVVKWNIYILEGQPPEPGIEVFRKVWGDRPNPPVITTVYVSKPANPDFLLEMDAMAVISQ